MLSEVNRCVPVQCKTYMALLCRILHSLMVHCCDDECVDPFSLSCLFLSECQLLRNWGEKKKYKTNQKKRKKETLCICLRLLQKHCRLLTVTNIDSQSRPAFLSCVDAMWSSLNYQLDTIQREPWTQTSGYSRDAIFS